MPHTFIAELCLATGVGIAPRKYLEHFENLNADLPASAVEVYDCEWSYGQHGVRCQKARMLTPETLCAHISVVPVLTSSHVLFRHEESNNYLEPNWPLFLKVNPQKQGPFQTKQGSFGF